MRNRIWTTVFVLALALLWVGAPARAIECYTPPQWQSRLDSPVMDADADGVEDTLVLASLVPVSVVVDLTKCVVPADIARIETYGTLADRGRYLSYLVLDGVSPSRLRDLANDPAVAFVEQNTVLETMLDVSRNVVGTDDVETTYGVLGSGINIAIVDSGVDDGIHDALPSTAYVAGIDCNGCTCSETEMYCESDSDCPMGESCGCTCALSGEDCITTDDCLNPPPPLPSINQCLSAPVCTLRNPDDNGGHGTHVASIALGRGGGDCPACRGVAPAAGLVDVKVVDPLRGATKGSVLNALEELLTKREEWEVRVANLSLGSCSPSDGQDAFSHMANRLVADGIVVVIAAGNYPSCGFVEPPFPPIVSSPGAADDVISVAWLEDKNTEPVLDDIISPGSFIGPRAPDADPDTDDELKPDIAAPGENILAADFDTAGEYSDVDGTSFAAPHVAGCAALALETDPDMLPLSVKELLLETAADAGPPGWDPAWGQGRLDCFAAVDEKAVTVGTDLGFEVFFCGEGLPAPCWRSPELVPGEKNIVEGVPNTVIATVTNFGAIDAPVFEVNLGVFKFGNSAENYHICRTEVFGLEAGESTSVSCDWIPMISGEPPGAVHACLKAEVIYPFDTNFENQQAQHNVNIGQSFSPVHFNIDLSNPTNQPIDLVLQDQWICECPPAGSGVFQCPCPGWVFQTDEPVIPLGPDDCPVTTELRLEPVDPATATRNAAVDVAIIGIDPGTGQPNGEFNGVTIEGELACQTNNLTWPDKVTFFWEPPPWQVCPDLFDVARGDTPITLLPDNSGGNFDGVNCVANNQLQNVYIENDEPPVGTMFYYLTATDGLIEKPGSWNVGPQVGDRDRSLNACRPVGP